MQLLRLLTTSLLSSGFILQASAQSPAISPTQTPQPPAVTITNPQTFTITNPQTFTTNSLPSTFSATLQKTPQSDFFHVDTSKDNGILPWHPDTDAQTKANVLTLLKQKQHEVTLAQTNAPCYTMRSYNLTAQDLQSPHPHASSETDCTPASSVKLKSIQAIEIQGIKK